MDWEDITKSPVWDDASGFGGNGNASIGDRIENGHCVTTGPFARLEVLYLGDDNITHCLSRGFEHSSALQTLGRNLQPAKVEKLLLQNDYESFNLGLEDGPHLSIPKIIRGDFAFFTAPNGNDASIMLSVHD